VESGVLNDYEADWRRWTPVLLIGPALGVLAAVVLICLGPVPSGYWLLLGIGYLLTLTGVEVGFHRHFSHQAFDAPLVVRYLLGILGSMAAQGPLLYWVSTHLRHHKHADREGDPHSPHVAGAEQPNLFSGLRHAHTGWIAGVDLARSYRFLPRRVFTDRVVMTVNRHFFAAVVVGLVLPSLAGLLIEPTPRGLLYGLVWGGLVRMFLVQHATFIVNSVCHCFGYTRFELAGDQSKNNFWLILPTIGGALHNNHHADPRSARTSVGGWEFDPGYWIIRTLELVGLAQVHTVRRRTEEDRAS
jgi:stearoyl-CoA desaturase (Delta-9 desaturase)